MNRKLLYHPFLIRFLNWEYWPFHLVYGPVYFYWFWLSVKVHSFFFFNPANPAIENGGFLMESKMEIYQLIPQKYYPCTFLFKPGSEKKKILDRIHSSQLKFPVIAKPDIGMQGKAVKKIHSEAELVQYAQQSQVNFLVQEFVSFEKEVGVFYYRYPDQSKGCISGIVAKEFLSVTGDGLSSIAALLKQSKRHILQLQTLKNMYGDFLNKILKPGEEFLLVPYGNHARGAKFVDVSHLIDEQLTNTIDQICKQVNGFYYGRLDIRFQSWEELKQGKNFSIIELNGAGSEPTHIYDPRHSIFFAWKEIIRHLDILFRISRINHQQLRKPYLNSAAGFRMLRANKNYLKLINREDK